MTAIEDLQHNSAQESRLDLALKLAEDELFTAKAGARVNDKNTKQVNLKVKNITFFFLFCFCLLELVFIRKVRKVRKVSAL